MEQSTIHSSSNWAFRRFVREHISHIWRSFLWLRGFEYSPFDSTFIQLSWDWLNEADGPYDAYTWAHIYNVYETWTSYKVYYYDRKYLHVFAAVFVCWMKCCDWHYTRAHTLHSDVNGELIKTTPTHEYAMRKCGYSLFNWMELPWVSVLYSVAYDISGYIFSWRMCIKSYRQVSITNIPSSSYVIKKYYLQMSKIEQFCQTLRVFIVVLQHRFEQRKGSSSFAVLSMYVLGKLRFSKPKPQYVSLVSDTFSTDIVFHDVCARQWALPLSSISYFCTLTAYHATSWRECSQSTI